MANWPDGSSAVTVVMADGEVTADGLAISCP